MSRAYSSLLGTILFWRLVLAASVLRVRCDVLFLVPGHFYRSDDGRVGILEDAFRACNQAGLNYWILVEEPNARVRFSFQGRSARLPLGLVRVARHLVRWYSNDPCKRDRLVGRILRRLFLSRLGVDVVVSVAQAMIHVSRGLFPDARVFDLQHGCIYSGHPGYFIGSGVLRPALVDSGVEFLLWGRFAAEVIRSTGSPAFIVGFEGQSSLSQCFADIRAPILVSLQITDDRSEEEARREWDAWLLFLTRLRSALASRFPGIVIRHHPRRHKADIFARDTIPSGITVFDAFESLSSVGFSVHLTWSSTAAIEVGMRGVPTISVDPLLPCERPDLLRRSLGFFRSSVGADAAIVAVSSLLDDKRSYLSECEAALLWAQDHIQPFSSLAFISSIGRSRARD